MRPDYSPDWKNFHTPDQHLVQRIRASGLTFAWAGLLMTTTVVIGWATRHYWFSSGTPQQGPIRLVAIASIGLLDIGLLLWYSGRGRLGARLSGAVVLALTSFVFVEYFFAHHYGSVGWFNELGPLSPDKIAPNSAFCLWTSALSLLLYSTPSRIHYRLGQALAIASALVSMVATIGYAYAVEPLYGIANYSAMSLPGAIAYLLLAMSLLVLHPDQGFMRILTTQTAAGVMSRRLYAAVLIVPPLLGLAAILGASSFQWYELSFAIALLVVSSMLLFALVIAITSVQLENADISRLEAEDSLRNSRKRLRELSAYMQVMQEEERIRIAREVHDELGQALTALKMDVSLLRNRLPENPEFEKRTASMMQLVNSTIKSVQRISAELRPSVLDDLGLAAAIEWQAREFESRSTVECSVHVPSNTLDLDQTRATSLFRIFQETLTNIARHANAKHVLIWLTQEAENVVLRVRDDGIGVSEQELNTTHSLGVMGMRERAELLGGSIEITGMPDAGTTVLVTIPLVRSSQRHEPFTETVIEEEEE